jgi:hypothetical protein
MSGLLRLFEKATSRKSKRRIHEVGIGKLGHNSSETTRSSALQKPPEPDYVLKDSSQYEERMKNAAAPRDPDVEAADLPEICDIFHNGRYPYSHKTQELELRPTSVEVKLLKDAAWYCRTCQFLEEASDVDYKDPTSEIEIKEDHLTGAPLIKVKWEDGDYVTYQLLTYLKGYPPNEQYDGNHSI